MNRLKTIYIVIILLTLSELAFSFDNNLTEDNLLGKIENLKAKLSDAQKSKKTEAEITVLKEIGSCFQQINNYDSAVYYYKKGEILAVTNQYEDLQSSLFYNLAIVCSNIGNQTEALSYGLKALELDKKLNKPENISSSLNSLAIIYQRQGLLDKALEHQLQAIDISEENNSIAGIANGYYNLGNIYNKLNKPEQAFNYFSRAKEKYLQLIETDSSKFQLMQGLSETIYSIGNYYLNKNEMKNALSEYNRALKIKKNILDKAGIANIYNQIGNIYYIQNNLTLATQNFFQSLQYKQLINDKKGVAIACFNISNIYLKQGKLTNSEDFLKKSIAIALSIDDKEVLTKAYLILSEIYEKKKVPSESLAYYKLHKAYADSVLNENISKIVEEISVKYETEKKEKENQILQQDNQIKTLQIQKQRTLGILFVGIIALALIILVILYFLYHSKKKTNKIISHKNTLLGDQNTQIAKQKRIIELKNIDLTDSIVYARRIQESLLADVSELNKNLNDAFIFLKPKDIVSGDFYWFGRKNNKFIFAAIDCTGHGVPGAFMSMLGSSFLDQIIYNRGITSPEKILFELNIEVQSSLKQAETNNQDGMDMALCTIDLETFNVEFAGAKNPLIYVRNNEAEKIRGDKFPIGRSYYENVNFTKHTIESNSETCFYMFSDGYIDQFGGPDNRKFMTKNLQKLLLNNHSKPMSEQKELLEKALNDWMEGYDQIDDILIVGFRLPQS